jgi:uncharacterized membrane protein YecN with MAPEG domain
MRITGLYVALGVLLVLILAVRVVMRRWTARIGIGDGNDKELRKRIRAHGNAVEYLPIGLLALLLLDLDGTTPVLLHVFGIALILARVAHAFGLSRTGGTSPERFFGITLTLVTLLIMAVLLLMQQFAR